MLTTLEKGRPLETETQRGRGIVAGLTFLHPPHLPGEPHNPPNSATLWCLLEHHPVSTTSGTPTAPHLGLNSAITAGRTKFNGLTAEGYIDINRDLGLEYSLDLASDGAISGEIESEATFPLSSHHSKTSSTTRRQITVGHQMRMWHRSKLDTLHSLRVSVPVLGGRGAAKIRARQHPASGGHAITLELGRKKNSSTRQANTLSSPKGGSTLHCDTESDTDEGHRWQGDPFFIPQFKLELEPAATAGSVGSPHGAPLLEIESNGGVENHQIQVEKMYRSVQWKQNWSHSLRTGASYHSRSQRVTLDCRARILPSMVVTASAAWDPAQRILQRISGKVVWRPRVWTPARHVVQLESRLNREAGAVHVVKLRRRPGQRGSGVEVNVAVSTKQGGKVPGIEFEFYMPT